MTTTTTTGTVTTINPEGATKATWKQMGYPQKFTFWGTAVKAPERTKGLKVAKVEAGKTGLVLKAANGRKVEGGEFGPATKLWSTDVDEASKPAPAEKNTTPREKLPELVIDAPKGGDRKVAPKKGALAKAIEASGKTISAIAREHGQNPSQLRRIALDTVAWVDLTRAESIAKALGVKVTDLFDAPVEKGNGKAKADPKPATTPANGKAKATTGKAPRKSKAQRAADQAAADQAKGNTIAGTAADGTVTVIAQTEHHDATEGTETPGE